MVRGLQSRSVLITFFGKKLRKPQLELLSMVATWIKKNIRKIADPEVVKGQLIPAHKFVVAPCHRGDGTIWDLDHFFSPSYTSISLFFGIWSCEMATIKNIEKIEIEKEVEKAEFCF